MLPAVTCALLLAACSATAAYSPAVSLADLVQRVSAACLESASQSVCRPGSDLTSQLEALAALPAFLQQLRDEQQQATQQLRDQQLQATRLLVGSQQETALLLQPSQKQMEAKLTALERKLAEHECPPGWIKVSNSCWLVPSKKVPWAKAHGECALLDHRARLGSMHKDAASVIASLSAERVWFGLSRLSSSPAWFWADGTSRDYTDWAATQPDQTGNHELCALIHETPGRHWHDYPCNHSYKFLCEIKL